MSDIAVALPEKELRDFCARWKIETLALFGSGLRDDFGPNSDLDFLVSFAPDASWGLLDHIRMERELEAILGRPVDLITRRAVERSENWLRREHILATARPVFDDAEVADATG